MAIKVMKSLYAKILSLDLKIGAHEVITNGYLINEETIDFFKEAEIKKVQITLDGIEEHHNLTRYLHNGEPTYSKIIENIKILIEHLPQLSIALRVNIDRTNSQDFMDIYKYVHEEMPNSNIFAYPGVIQLERKDGCSMCYSTLDSKEMFALFKDFYRQGANVKFLPQKAKHRGCMINSVNSLIIGPQGEIYKCWNDVNHIDRALGNLNEPEKLNQKLLTLYALHSHQFSSVECKECKSFPLCTGGCGLHRVRNYKDGAKFDVCSPYRDESILKEALVLSTENNKSKYKQTLHL